MFQHCWPCAAAAAPFSFVALGDMPYSLPEDFERVDRLIARNAKAVALAFQAELGWEHDSFDHRHAGLTDTLAALRRPSLKTSSRGL